MKKLLLLLSLSSVLSVQAAVPGLIENLAPNHPPLRKGQEACVYHNFAGAPVLNFGADGNQKIMARAMNLCRMGYFSYYDPVTKTPLWVSENLNPSKLLNPKDVIGDFFASDPDIPATSQANLNDYKGTSFNIGHMAPSEDMNSEGSDQKLKNSVINQSLYLTNMAPQVGLNMDKGIWHDIELQIRAWAGVRTNLLVVTGPIFDNKANPVTIGASKVWVPTRYYKVVFDAMNGKSIAFVVPNVQVITSKTKALDAGNRAYSQTLPSSAYNCGKVCKVSNFVTSVSEVEKVSNLKFFPNAKGINLGTVDTAAWKMTE